MAMDRDDEQVVRESSEPAVGRRIASLPGVIAELGELGAGALVTEQGLAALFDRHESSVKRAVERGELPPPVRMFGQSTWTAGVLVQHIEKRLEHAAKEAERIRNKVVKLAP